MFVVVCFFFFKQKTAYEMRISDWSSDVCSSDLRPALLRRQLRALLHAAAGRSLSVMFPMISDVAEFEAAKALLQREIEREKAFGDRLPADIRVGAMLEVPALALQFPPLLPRCDFRSRSEGRRVRTEWVRTGES